MDHPRHSRAALGRNSGEGAFDTGSRARVAWKTGTSYGFRDAWALGSTARYTVGVWVGRPDGTPMPGQYGAITALPLMFEVVDSLPQVATGQGSRAPPASVRKKEICWPLGLPRDSTEPGLCRQSRQAWALRDVVPPTFAERDARLWSSGKRVVRIDADSGRRLSANCTLPHAESTLAIARWPSVAYPWLAISERRATAIPPLAEDCDADSLAAMEVLQIDGPAPDSAIARAPDSPRAPQVRLRALGTNARVRWLVNGELVGESQGGASFVHAFAALGDQRITALADTGAWAELRLRVLR